jgi:flagellar protein FlaG
MSTTAPIPSIGPDVAPSKTTQDPPGGSSEPAVVAQPDAPAAAAVQEPLNIQDLRLVIEEDQSAGSYVYKTIDPRTGKVIAQIPREELLKLKEKPDYRPGSVINAQG